MHGIAYYSSPVGVLQIESKDNKITKLGFLRKTREQERHTPVINQCISQLNEYFSGQRKLFSFELEFHGSDFQIRAWQELLKIPYGETISYEAQAIRVGDIKMTRAVGIANAQNPIAIVVPCHRVIGKNGDLVGYGGGLERKVWLLEHEGAMQKQLSIF